MRNASVLGSEGWWFKVPELVRFYKGKQTNNLSNVVAVFFCEVSLHTFDIRSVPSFNILS